MRLGRPSSTGSGSDESSLSSAVPAVRPTARRAAATTAVVGLAVFLIPAVLYAGLQGPAPLDAWADSRLQGMLHAVPLQWVVDVGGPVGTTLATALLAGLCMIRQRRRLAVVIVLGVCITAALTVMAQSLIGRTTVYGGDALPSGHVAGITAFVVAAALVVGGAAPLPAANILALGVAIAPTAAMTLAVIVNGYHYATDTVAAVGLAVTVVLTIALTTDLACERWEHHILDRRRQDRSAD